MKSLMVMQPDPESFCRIKDDLLKKNNRVECPYLLHSWPPELEKGFVQAQEGVPG
jgi:hypothetical protein